MMQIMKLVEYKLLSVSLKDKEKENEVKKLEDEINKLKLQLTNLSVQDNNDIMIKKIIIIQSYYRKCISIVKSVINMQVILFQKK